MRSALSAVRLGELAIVFVLSLALVPVEMRLLTWLERRKPRDRDFFGMVLVPGQIVAILVGLFIAEAVTQAAWPTYLSAGILCAPLVWWVVTGMLHRRGSSPDSTGP